MLRTFACQRCGQLFEKRYYPSRSLPVYCSPKCRKDRVEITCATCGKVFSVPRSRKDIRKHCSRECMDKSIRRPEQICKWCGKKYRPIKTGNSFCSLRCAIDIRKATRLHKICETCEKEFIVKKGYVGARFCSHKCSSIGIAMHGPDNPNWKGGCDSDRGPNWHKQSWKARKRDNYTCQMCSLVRKNNPALPVHHIQRYHEFNDDYITANDLSNLITLCSRCHGVADNNNRTRNELGQFRERAF